MSTERVGDPIDLLVVGGGTAGLPTAIEAAENGLSVLLVEKSDHLGGTLWRSWAQMSAAGTELQSRHGIHDDPDLHYDDVMRISRGTANPELVRLAVDHGAQTIDWLMSRGFDMDPDAPAILYFHEPYSVARTYWGRNAGRSVLDVLLPEVQRHIDRGRIRVRTGTDLVGLRGGEGPSVEAAVLRDATGAVEEVEAHAVVLATGGYAGNPRLFPLLTDGAPLRGPAAPTSAGEGIIAALALGARLRGRDMFLPTYGGTLRPDSDWVTSHLDDYPLLTPQSRLPWEIHVNRSGRRFVAEDDESVDNRENALTRQSGLEFWIVYDQGAAEEAPPLFPAWEREDLEKAFTEHPSFARADDLDELAALTGIDPQGLRATVEEYNAAVATGTDPWGRTHLPAPIDRAPFHAVRNHGTALKSPAGLTVDGRLRVLGADDRPFTNLYAVGEALGGSSMSGRSFVSGMSVTPALSFGRLIGRAVAGADHHRRT